MKSVGTPSEDVQQQVDFAVRFFFERHGLIPDEAWTGPRNFETSERSARLQGYIVNIAARARWRMSQEIDPLARIKISNEAKSQIYGLFVNAGLTFPTTFLFRGRSYTPTTFARHGR